MFARIGLLLSGLLILLTVPFFFLKSTRGQAWVKDRIERGFAESDVDVEIGGMDVDLFPPVVRLSRVSVRSRRAGLLDVHASVALVRARLAVLPLIKGAVRFADVQVDSPRLEGTLLKRALEREKAATGRGAVRESLPSGHVGPHDAAGDMERKHGPGASRTEIPVDKFTVTGGTILLKMEGRPLIVEASGVSVAYDGYDPAGSEGPIPPPATGAKAPRSEAVAGGGTIPFSRPRSKGSEPGEGVARTILWSVTRASVRCDTGETGPGAKSVEACALNLVGMELEGRITQDAPGVISHRTRVGLGAHRLSLEGEFTREDGVPSGDFKLEAETDLAEWGVLAPAAARIKGWPSDGNVKGVGRVVVVGRHENLDADGLSADVELSLKNMRWGRAQASEISGALAWKDRALELKPLKIVSNGTSGPPAVATIGGSVRRTLAGDLKMALNLEVNHLGRSLVSEWFPVVRAIGRHAPLKAGIVLAGPWPALDRPWELTGKFRGESALLELARDENRFLRLKDLVVKSDLVLRNADAEFRSARLEGKGIDLRGHARVRKEDFRIELGSARMELEPLSPVMGLDVKGSVEVGGVWTRNGGMDLFDGSVRSTHLTINNRKMDAVAGDLRLEDKRLMVDRIEIRMPHTVALIQGEASLEDSTFQAVMDVKEGELKDVALLAGVSPDLVRAVSGRSYGRLELSGRLQPELRIASTGKVVIEEPLIGDEQFEEAGIQWVSATEGDLPSASSGDLQPGFPGTSPVAVRGFVRHREGSIDVQGRIDPDGKINGDWSVTTFPIDRLWPAHYWGYTMGGRVEGRGALSGTIRDPHFNGQLEVREVILDGEAVQDSILWVEKTGKGMRVLATLLGDEIRLDGSLDPRAGMPFVLTAELRKLQTQHVLNMFGPMTEFKGVLNGQVVLKGEALHMESWNGLVQIEDFEFTTHGLLARTTAPMVLPVKNGVMVLNTHVIETSNGEVVVGGRIDLPHSMDVEARGRIGLDLTESIFPIVVAQAAGSIDFKAKIQGPLRLDSLIMIIDAEIRSGRVHFREFPHPLESFQAKVEITQNGFFFERFEGVMGGGPVQGHGRVGMDEYYLEDVFLTATAYQSQVRFPSWIAARVDAELYLTGPIEAPLFTGQVKMLNGYVVENLDWRRELFGFVDFRGRGGGGAEILNQAPDHGIRYDLHVVGAVNVRNNLARGDFVADLRITGADENMNLFGEVKGTQGFFYFKNREFRIDRALVLFNDPIRIDPEIEVYGTTVLEDVPGNVVAAEFSGGAVDPEDPQRKVKVNVNVFFSARGRPLYSREGEFKLQFYSDPPLAESDLLSLIYFNQPWGVGLTAGGADLEFYTIILNQISRELAQGPLRRFLGLETIEFDPAQTRSGQQFLSLVVTKPVEQGRQLCPQDLKWRGLLNVGDPSSESRIELDCRLLPNLSLDVYGQSPGDQSDRTIRAGAEMKIRFEFW